MRSVTILLGIWVLFMLVMVGMIAYMIATIGKQGDERRRMIIRQAAANCFYVTVGLYLFDIIRNLWTSIVEGVATRPGTPFARLAVLAIFFVLQLVYFDRKYGA